MEFFDKIFSRKWTKRGYSLLRPNQIYQVFYLIVELRKLKQYKLADYLRERLEKLGHKDINHPNYEHLWQTEVINKRLKFPKLEDFMKTKKYKTLDIFFTKEKSIVSGVIQVFGEIKETRIYLEL